MPASNELRPPKLNFSKRPPTNQQSGMGMPPIGALKGLLGGGSGGGGGFLSGLSGGGGGGAAGGAGGGAGSGAGGMIASAGPWAALAAVIIGNEMYAEKHGYRSEDPKEHLKDLLTGEVQHQDLEQRWLPKLGIEDDSKTSDFISLMTNLSPLNFSEQWDRLKNIF